MSDRAVKLADVVRAGLVTRIEHEGKKSWWRLEPPVVWHVTRQEAREGKGHVLSWNNNISVLETRILKTRILEKRWRTTSPHHRPSNKWLAMIKVLVEITVLVLQNIVRRQIAEGIARPPGARLGHILTLVFGKRVYVELLEQHLVDHRDEWVEAQAGGHEWHARWLHVRCTIALLWSVLGALPIEKVRGLLLGTGEGKKKSADD